MMYHPEAVSAPTSHPAWALVLKGPNGVATVVASSAAVSNDVVDIGPGCEDLGIPAPPHLGFWLWRGASWFDGLDGTGLETDSLEPLSFKGAAARMSMHEPI